jgi:NAD(P)H dehydrogenase (quinone)
MMNALIVYANPEPTSFSGALKDVSARILRDAGCGVEISDLYGENFNPVAGRHDFTTVADPARFHYQTEQGHAFANDGYAADLKREQARFKKADLLVVHFPLWWGGMPAILKGWFDRVLAYGFAYVDGKRYDTGYFRGRRGILCVTTGGTAERFSAGGVYGPIEQVLYPVNRCMIEYLGLEALDPFIAYAAPRVDDAARKDYLRAWEARLREIVAQPALEQV